MSTNAKRHPLLADVTGMLSGRLPEIEEEVAGHRYKLRLLKPEGEDWVAMHTTGNTYTAALLNWRKPTLAAALVSISFQQEDGSWDEVPVEKLFELPSDMDVKAKEALMADPKLLRDWRREQILEWLREDMASVVLNVLYDAYEKLLPKQKEAMKELSGFSKGTPSVA